MTPYNKALTLTLRDPTLFGTSLLAIVLDLLGAQALDWDPSVLRSALFTYTGVTLLPTQSDRLQAAIGLLCSDRVLNDWLVVNHLAESLDGEGASPDVEASATPEQLAWLAVEYKLLVGAPYEPSEEVWVYIGQVLLDHGLHTAPKQLSGAVMPPVDTAMIDEEVEIGPAFHKKELELKEAVDDHVKQQSAALIQQLNTIPLAKRDHDTWQKLVKAVKDGQRQR